MNDAPRYTSLTDYLAVLRRQRFLILIVVLAFTAAGYALSNQQTPSYAAEAFLSLREPAIDADPVGLPIGFRAPANERAAIHARLVSRPAVADEVQREIRTQRSPGELLGMVSARPETKTNFLVIGAVSSNPEEAALVANGFARTYARQQTRVERRRLRQVSAALKQRLRRLQRSPTPTDAYTTVGFTDRIARTDALASTATPVELVRPAQVPGAPYSPKTTRNTLLGALLGLTIAILAAFGRDSLDRRLRNTSDIERHAHLSALTRLSSRALGTTGLAANGRRALAPADIEAVRILRANIRFLDAERPPRSIAVTSSMPEEGKTTVATSLACATAAAGSRVLLIECDLHRPAVAERLGLRPEPGLVDYLAGKVSWSDAMQAVHPARLARGGVNGNRESHEPLLWCITAGTLSENSGELLQSTAFHELVAVASRAYDSVILDTGPLLPVVDSLAVVPLVDAVLLCVRASRTTRDQVTAAQKALERLPTGPIGLVVTGVRADGADGYGYAPTDHAQAASS